MADLEAEIKKTAAMIPLKLAALIDANAKKAAENLAAKKTKPTLKGGKKWTTSEQI